MTFRKSENVPSTHCDVGISGFVDEGSALLLGTCEKVKGNKAVSTFNELTEFRFRDENSLFMVGAGRTLSKSPVDFGTILKANVSDERPSSFYGPWRYSLAERTQKIVGDDWSLSLLGHGVEG